MRRVGFLAFFLLTTLTMESQAAIEWTFASGGNGHRYELAIFPSNISWTDARDFAAASTLFGSPGHLVTITSAAEDDFLRMAFQSQIGDPNTGVPGVYAWIGLTDEISEGNFQWVTGEPFSYSNWAPPEPNNLGNEDYVHLWVRKFTGTSVDPNGTPLWSWNDAINAPGFPNYTGALLEYEGPFTLPSPDPIPEPASLLMWIAVASLGFCAFRSCSRGKVHNQRTIS